jgi:hypothetical protein
VTNVQTELQQIGVQQTDAPTGYFVGLFNGGDQVNGQVTLNLCGADYPSEAVRVARYQVGVAQSPQSSLLLSTEAVAYRDPAATSQAFSELSHAAGQCPNAYVQGKIAGEPPLRTVLGPQPDTGWSNVAGVDRLAFDATVSDQKEHSQEHVDVFVKRGRILIGVYIRNPESPVAVDGNANLEGIVNVFAQRLAALPEAAVG